MKTTFKLCLCCNSKNRPLVRKCAVCTGDMFRQPTSEEVAEHYCGIQRLNDLLAEILKGDRNDGTANPEANTHSSQPA